MPFSPERDSDPPLILPDLLAGLLNQAEADGPMEALTPEIMAPEEPMPESLRSAQAMPEFLANLRHLLTEENVEPPDAEFPPEAAQDFPLGTNELLNYLLSELAEPPPPPEDWDAESAEDFSSVTNELLGYLLNEVAEPPEPPPGKASPEAVSDFEAATQDLLNELLAMTAHPEPEREPEHDVAFHDAKRDLLGGLMASLVAEEAREIEAPRVEERVVVPEPEPEPAAEPILAPIDEPAPAPVEASLDLESLTKGLLDGLLAGALDPPEPPAPAAAPVSELGAAPLEYVDESDIEEVDRPAGPFELLLDAIDSELGPAPEMRGTVQAVPKAKLGERLVAFGLGERMYALPFDCVLETDRLPKSTFVPGMPAHVRGVLNLRGEILPLIDLRILFGVSGSSKDGRMLVIRDAGAKAPMALVVDHLGGLTMLAPEAMARKTSAEHDPAASVLRGIVNTGGRPVGLVDLERIVNAAHGDGPLPKHRVPHLPIRGRSYV